MSTQITAADQGKTVDAKVGQSLTLKLPGNPTTGYTWAVQGGDDSLCKVDKQYKAAAAGMIGGGGEFEFHFTPQKAGSVPIKLAYLREFEGLKDSDKTFEVTLNAS